MRILVVDDDPELSAIVTFALERAGFRVVRATDGEAALREWRRTQPDLLLLDWNMPKQDGLQVLEQVRAASLVPVIILTVRNAEEDVLRAFEAGADDYICKPFSPRQLVARVQAALRRVGRHVQQGDEVVVGDLRLRVSHQQVISGRESDPIHLTPLETRLLEVLMGTPGEPYSPDRLIEAVWGYDSHLGDHMLLKGLVRRLRRKIERDPSHPRYLKTWPKVGYVLAPEDILP